MDVHFILEDRPVTRENVASFGPSVTAERLDRIARVVNATAEEVLCAKHARAADDVVCRGASLATLDFEVRACCEDFSAALAGRLRQRVPSVVAAPPAGAMKTAPGHRIRRIHRAFGPILAGLVIDSVDLLTFGPLKRFVGFPVGALAGYWMGSIFQLPMRQRLWCALAAGVYCFIPGLEFVPLATLIGAYVRYRGAGDPESD